MIAAGEMHSAHVALALPATHRAILEYIYRYDHYEEEVL